MLHYVMHSWETAHFLLYFCFFLLFVRYSPSLFKLLHLQSKQHIYNYKNTNRAEELNTNTFTIALRSSPSRRWASRQACRPPRPRPPLVSAVYVFVLCIILQFTFCLSLPPFISLFVYDFWFTFNNYVLYIISLSLSPSAPPLSSGCVGMGMKVGTHCLLERNSISCLDTIVYLTSYFIQRISYLFEGFWNILYTQFICI